MMVQVALDVLDARLAAVKVEMAVALVLVGLPGVGVMCRMLMKLLRFLGIVAWTMGGVVVLMSPSWQSEAEVGRWLIPS